MLCRGSTRRGAVPRPGSDRSFLTYRPGRHVPGSRPVQNMKQGIGASCLILCHKASPWHGATLDIFALTLWCHATVTVCRGVASWLRGLHALYGVRSSSVNVDLTVHLSNNAVKMRLTTEVVFPGPCGSNNSTEMVTRAKCHAPLRMVWANATGRSAQ